MRNKNEEKKSTQSAQIPINQEELYLCMYYPNKTCSAGYFNGSFMETGTLQNIHVR